jgi:hypothetical protein
LPLLTLYNGRTSSKGTPTLILQGEFPPGSGVIDGTFSKKTGGTLDITFPVFAGGRADLTSFTFTFTKPGYASARCRTTRLTLRSFFRYAASGSAGAPTQSPSATIEFLSEEDGGLMTAAFWPPRSSPPSAA